MYKFTLLVFLIFPELVYACSCRSNSFVESWEDSIEVVHVTIEGRKAVVVNNTQQSKFNYKVNRSYKKGEVATTGEVSTGYIQGKMNCETDFDIGISYILFIPKERYIPGCGVAFLRHKAEPMSYLDFDNFIAIELEKENVFKLFKRISNLSEYQKDINLSKAEVRDIEKKRKELEKKYKNLSQIYYD